MTNDHLYRSFWRYWFNKRLYKRSCLPFDHHKAGSRMIQTALSLCAHPAWVPFSSPWTAHSKHQNFTFVLYLPRTIQISRQRWKYHCSKSQTYTHAIKAHQIKATLAVGHMKNNCSEGMKNEINSFCADNSLTRHTGMINCVWLCLYFYRFLITENVHIGDMKTIDKCNWKSST